MSYWLQFGSLSVVVQGPDGWVVAVRAVLGGLLVVGAWHSTLGQQSLGTVDR